MRPEPLRLVGVAAGGLFLFGASPAPADTALMTLSAADETLQVQRSDVVAMEISESGGITDLFVRLSGDAGSMLAALTARSVGNPMQVRVCGTVLMQATVRDEITSGTIYLAGTTMVRAEAMRALWHGRARCDTLAPEVFANGQ